MSVLDYTSTAFICGLVAWVCGVVGVEGDGRIVGKEIIMVKVNIRFQPDVNRSFKTKVLC